MTMCRWLSPAMGIGMSMVCATVDARVIDWSGYQWAVRDSGISNPGPGPYSAREDHVWVDDRGRLHLNIQQIDGQWTFSEVAMLESLSYGRYEFEVESRYDQYASNVVAGLFTYLDPNRVANQTAGAVSNGVADTPHEIDIELTQAFGAGGNLYYTTHDPDVPSPSRDFTTSLSGDFTTHRFTWEPDQIHWESFHGHVAGVEQPPFAIREERGGNAGAAAEFTYTGPVIPEDLNEQVLINFWVFSGGAGVVTPPSDGQAHELILNEFRYTPLDELLVPEPHAAAALLGLVLWGGRRSR